MVRLQCISTAEGALGLDQDAVVTQSHSMHAVNGSTSCGDPVYMLGSGVDQSVISNMCSVQWMGAAEVLIQHRAPPIATDLASACWKPYSLLRIYVQKRCYIPYPCMPMTVYPP